MAYNNYFPVGYQPQYQFQQAQQNNGIIWVDGENSARSYIVPAGQSVLLMDSNTSCFYIKSADVSGMPLPLRIFDYSERKQAQAVNSMPTEEKAVETPNMALYVTKEELEQRLAELIPKKKEKKNE